MHDSKDANEGLELLEGMGHLREDKMQKASERIKEMEAAIAKENLKERKADLYREREVDNLHSMIYGDKMEEDEATVDTARFDTADKTLQRYLQPAMKRALKRKFVTGKSISK